MKNKEIIEMLQVIYRTKDIHLILFDRQEDKIFFKANGKYEWLHKNGMNILFNERKEEK